MPPVIPSTAFVMSSEQSESRHLFSRRCLCFFRILSIFESQSLAMTYERNHTMNPDSLSHSLGGGYVSLYNSAEYIFTRWKRQGCAWSDNKKRIRLGSACRQLPRRKFASLIPPTVCGAAKQASLSGVPHPAGPSRLRAAGGTLSLAALPVALHLPDALTHWVHFVSRKPGHKEQKPRQIALCVPKNGTQGAASGQRCPLLLFRTPFPVIPSAPSVISSEQSESRNLLPPVPCGPFSTTYSYSRIYRINLLSGEWV